MRTFSLLALSLVLSLSACSDDTTSATSAPADATSSTDTDDTHSGGDTQEPPLSSSCGFCSPTDQGGGGAVPCEGYSPSECKNTDGCEWSLLSKGTECDDGDDSTLNDACTTAGICEGETGVECPAVTACTTAWQRVGDSCEATYAPAGTSCDDGSNETSDDVCDGQGTCAGITPQCGFCWPTDQEGGGAVPCEGYEASECKDMDGCKWSIVSTGTACDDGDENTLNDTCNDEGICVGEAL